jgi:hypothetical protein
MDSECQHANAGTLAAAIQNYLRTAGQKQTQRHISHTILAVFCCVISEGVGSGRLFLHELYLSGSAITFNLEVEAEENDGTFLLTRQRQARR